MIIYFIKFLDSNESNINIHKKNQGKKSIFTKILSKKSNRINNYKVNNENIEMENVNKVKHRVNEIEKKIEELEISKNKLIPDSLSAFKKRHIYENERKKKEFNEGMKNHLIIPALSLHNFVLNIYNNEDEELKKEILKYFVINKVSKNPNKSASNKNKNKNKSKKDNSNEIIKNDNDNNNSLTENDFDIYNTDKSDLIFEEKNLEELMIRYDNHNKKIDLITDDNFHLNENDNNNDNNIKINYINKNEINDIESNFEIKVELKYSLFYTYLNLLILFFKNEYQPLTLVLNLFNEINKTGILSIIVFRLFASLTILSMLNGKIGVEKGKSTTVKFYLNENLFNFRIINFPIENYLWP